VGIEDCFEQSSAQPPPSVLLLHKTTEELGERKKNEKNGWLVVSVVNRKIRLRAKKQKKTKNWVPSSS